VEKVSETIGARIEPWTCSDWLNVFKGASDFELYKYRELRFNVRSESEIKDYVNYFVAKPHLAFLDSQVKAAIYQRWYETISIFNENHKYLGAIYTIFRKRPSAEEPEFFTLRETY
jgi:hypothetical protein